MSEQSQSAADLEIEVIDDTPEEDRGRPRRPEGAEPYDVKDEEISQYSESVQSRIKRLRFEFHEERRQKQAADRERQEALRITQQVMEENRRLQKIAEENAKLAREAAQKRAESQLEQAKRAARDAMEAGDTERAVEANAQLARYAIEHERLSNYVPEPAPREERREVQQEMPKPRQPDGRAVEWAKRNPWFGSDEEMTSLAYGVHEKLVKQGVNPQSDEYYQSLDSAIRRRFPERFEAEAEERLEVDAAPTRKPAPVVAPANRSSVAPRRKVQLTATQVALANKLGITVEQYAAELLRNNNV